MHVNLHAFGVNVANLQAERFTHAQPERVHRPEISSIAWLPDGRHQLVNLVDGQHIGQRLLFWNPQLREHLPVARFGIGEEEFESTVGDSQRAGREVTIVDQIQQIVGDLLFGELIGRGVVMTGQFANFAEVTVMSPLRHAPQLQILRHAFTQRLRVAGGVTVRRGKVIVCHENSSLKVKETISKPSHKIKLQSQIKHRYHGPAAQRLT